jgi:uncharacterized protein YggE
MKSIAVVRRGLLALLWASLVGMLGMTAEAEDSPGITVSGSGVAEAMPDTVELTATVEGNAELAGDAVEKYRGNKRRFLESLNKLNIKGISIVGSGLSINSGTPVNMMAALQAGQANQPKAADKVAFQERLTVTLAGIDTMSADELLQSVTRIVDVVKDAGVAIGPGPKSMIEMQFGGAKAGALATFKLSKTDLLRQQAYEAAVKQARATAERLAKLAGVELGDIVSIRETVAASKDDASGGGIAAYLALFSGGATSNRPDYTSTELQSIPVTVSLSVQFDIKKK